MGSAGVRLGGWLSMSDPLIVEAAGRSGFDWVGLDLQHGSWDLGRAIRSIQLLDLLDVPVLVRVHCEELQLIPHVLDQGAAGIILAMTSTPDVVAAAVSRARYQPEGQRSYGGQRYGLRAEAADVSTIRPAIYAMVESRESVERISEIAAVPGLAGVHIGPVDLGLSLGLGNDRNQPLFRDAVRTIVTATHAAGLPAVIHAISPPEVADAIAQDFDELVLTADIGLLRKAFADEVAHARDRSAELRQRGVGRTLR